MRFKLISTGNCSFSVVLADVRSAKQLNITELELEDPALISRESVISEIRERTGKFFTCEESINLEIDEKTTLKSWTIMETLIGVTALIVSFIVSIFA